MRIVGVVGSPRRELGLTNQVVGQALAGAAEAGAETSVIYLADQDIRACGACGASCFQDQVCRLDEDATMLSAQIDEFDGLILGAPVYTWRPNALTAIFQDKLRLRSGSLIIGTLPAKPALGIAVAGGTGSGVMGALQSIYRWLAVWAYRALAPIPVARYNLAAALVEARSSGRALVEAAAAPRPFASHAECLLHYDALPYLGSGYVDEFLWLARAIDADLPADDGSSDARTLREGLRAAESALARGDRSGAAEAVAPAYLAGRRAWLALHP